jgi:methylglutaconyl-CoA hydratase
MTEPLVRYESRPPAVLLTLNRPDKRNALSRELIAALKAAVERARDDASARCVLLTGSGPAFCAGMDLAELSATVDADQATIWNDAVNYGRLLELIYTLPNPTIAVVNGAAVAGGAGFVSVCDLAVAVPDAKFGYPEVRRGLVAAMVMPHLLRHVGERMARWLLLTGELIDAATAAGTGFINAVVSREDLLPTADHWVKSLAEGGPQALAATKELLRTFSRQAMSVEETAKASAAPRLGDECRAGLRAFFEKRPAPWTTP